MKNHISLFIFAIALLSGPVSANDLSMTAVKDTLASIPGEHNYIYVRTPLGEDEEKNYDEITFYDGLGRELDFAQSYGADRAGAIMAALGLLQSMLGFDETAQGLMIALYIAMDSFGTATNVTVAGDIAIIVNRVNK